MSYDTLGPWAETRRPSGAVAMTLDQATFDVAVVGESRGGLRGWLHDGLRRVMMRRGYRFHDQAPPNIRLVLNFIQTFRPRPFRRRSKATFVVSVAEAEHHVENLHPRKILREGYPLLVRALSNVLLYLVRSRTGPMVYFVTMEQGCYPIPYDGSEGTFFERVYEHLEPLATSTLFIDNEFVPDLPPSLRNGDAVTEQICAAGQRLDRLGLLPAPFPLEELVDPDD